MNKFILKSVFKTTLPFADNSSADVLLIYCSDFRFRKHFWQFQDRVIDQKTHHRKIDRIIQPGGHLLLFAHHWGYPDADLAERYWVKFLALHHQIKEIILVGHAGCAAYAGAKKLAKKSPAELRQIQLEDLVKAKKLLSPINKKLKIKLYFAEAAAGKGVLFSELV